MTFLVGIDKEIQINNFRDHTKMILCPLMGAVTTLEPGKSMRTFKFSSIENSGCTPELLQNVRNVKEEENSRPSKNVSPCYTFILYVHCFSSPETENFYNKTSTII